MNSKGGMTMGRRRDKGVMLVPSNVEARVLYRKNINPHLVLKKKLSKNLFRVFLDSKSERFLRKRFAVPNDKFLKCVFSFDARINTCVILCRHVFVTSLVVATRIFSHTLILFQFQRPHEIKTNRYDNLFHQSGI